ncbi:hypothetical protein Pcinc_014696 [Petrolisthes cinctipes]|uniref:Uncharacterized protein n=1 Tax=Petrolisthes cinctipes TaxID=88211 RepID=A0AAE1KR57_PETCI|nr:hypothetical protein Pcinc_014696 [Petrolisthes cinctipes]
MCWPHMLQQCQIVMNQALHTSMGKQLYFAFSRYPPILADGACLPSVTGDEDDLALAHDLIHDTHQKRSQRYRDVANRKQRNQSVKVGVLVWVKRETEFPSTIQKLNVKWNGPYKVIKVK